MKTTKRKRLERRAKSLGLDSRAVKQATTKELRISIRAVQADRKLFKGIKKLPMSMIKRIRRL